MALYTYLPCVTACRFVAAGAVTEVTSAGVSAATQLEVVSRSMNMLLWLLKDMNVITAEEVCLGPSVSGVVL